MAINLIIYASHVFFGLGQAYATGGSGPTLTNSNARRSVRSKQQRITIRDRTPSESPGGSAPALFSGISAEYFLGCLANFGAVVPAHAFAAGPKAPYD